jgi:hypothetical protein
MTENEHPEHPLRQLHAVLDRLVRRMTRRLYGTPREMQMDASAAIGLLLQAEVPNREYLAGQMASLVRELGQRRPDLLRYIVTVESTLTQIEERLRAE